MAIYSADISPCYQFEGFVEWLSEIYTLISMHICDQACENQPCEHKKIPDFFHLRSIITYELFVQAQ